MAHRGVAAASAGAVREARLERGAQPAACSDPCDRARHLTPRAAAQQWRLCRANLEALRSTDPAPANPRERDPLDLLPRRGERLDHDSRDGPALPPAVAGVVARIGDCACAAGPTCSSHRARGTRRPRGGDPLRRGLDRRWQASVDPHGVPGSPSCALALSPSVSTAAASRGQSAPAPERCRIGGRPPVAPVELAPSFAGRGLYGRVESRRFAPRFAALAARFRASGDRGRASPVHTCPECRLCRRIRRWSHTVHTPTTCYWSSYKNNNEEHSPESPPGTHAVCAAEPSRLLPPCASPAPRTISSSSSRLSAAACRSARACRSSPAS